MSDRSIVALFKRAAKRAIALSLFQKERKSENERLLIFKIQNEQMPNPSGKKGGNKTIYERVGRKIYASLGKREM